MEEQQLPPRIEDAMLPSSTLAIVSLVSALLGFTLFPVVGGIVAIITTYMARNETRSFPPKASGDSMATAGIVMGWVQVALLVVGICCLAVWFLFGLGWLGISLNQ
jgi:hypothetical protein